MHNALFSGDLQQIQALFQDEDAANMIVETVSNQLAWSAEQGKEHPLGAGEEGWGGREKGGVGMGESLGQISPLQTGE